MSEFSDLASQYGAKAFSYSKLSEGLKCPFKYNKVYVERERPTNKVDKSIALTGTVVHTIIENSLLKLDTVTDPSFDEVKAIVIEKYIAAEKEYNLSEHEVLEIAHFESNIEEVLYRIAHYVKAKEAIIYTEKALAFDANFQPVSYNSPEAFFRGKIDLLIVHPTGNVDIVDHKTGFPNKKGHLTQLQTYELLVTYALAPALLKERGLKVCTVRSGINFIVQDRVSWEPLVHINEIEMRSKPWFINWVNEICESISLNKVKRGKHCNRCGYRSFCGSRVGLKKKKAPDVLL